MPGHGAVATVGGRRLAVGNPRLMAREGVPLGALEARRGELAAEGKTVVCVAVDGRAVGLLAIADAPRSTSRQAVAALRQAGIEAEAAGWPWSATA